MQKTYQVSGASAFEFNVALKGGHTLLAVLWYDEEGPGWWNIAGTGGYAEFAWDIGPLTGSWQTSVRTQHEYDSELPFHDKTFKHKKGTTQYEFWLDLRAASNTGQPTDFIVEFQVAQNGASVAPDDGTPVIALKPGKVSVDNYVKVVFQV